MALPVQKQSNTSHASPLTLNLADVPPSPWCLLSVRVHGCQEITMLIVDCWSLILVLFSDAMLKQRENANKFLK